MSDLDKIIDKVLEEPLYEMANIGNKDTGLSNQNLMIYISTKQGSHGPRIKVFEKGKPNNTISFSIAKESVMLTDNTLKLSKTDIQEIKYWIYKNEIVLLNLWKSDYKNVEIFDILRELDKI